MAAERIEALASHLTDAVRHRGPDADGIWTDAPVGVGFGHRRLSIVDLSPTGAQPMQDASGRYVITYNGEIYNAPELRHELEQFGHTFVGTSDTEILLAAIAQWGLESALRHTVGMFAFALWDKKQKTLSLARDRVGKKPLYFYQRNGLVVFGSEIKVLLSHPDVHAELNLDAVASYLRLAYVPSPLAIFRYVEKVAPATIVQFREGAGVRHILYWDMESVAENGLRAPRTISIEQAIEEADLLLRDAAIKRTLSDVPLGVFLSGGIDSSLIAAVLQAQLSQKVRTFSVGFTEQRYDESGAARKIAEHLGTDHTEMFVTADDALGIVPHLPDWFDEPFADSSQIPTHLLSAMTRRHVTVALSGDGGDEIAAGYIRYGAISHWWPILSRLPLPIRHGFSSLIRNLPIGFWERAANALSVSRRPPHIDDRARKFAGLLDSSDPQKVYRTLVSHWNEPSEILAGANEPRPIYEDERIVQRLPNLVGRFQYFDMASYLPDDILCKVDRASMAVALEVRAPLLDHRVVEYFWSLPREMLCSGNRRKLLLRKILARYVPEALFDRPKMGFGAPIEHWLRGPLRDWAEDLLDEHRIRREGLFRPEPIRRLWDAHVSGRSNHQYQLWTILMFQSWRRRWLDGHGIGSNLPSPRIERVAHPVELH